MSQLNNPQAAMRQLITYALVTFLAIGMGYLLSDPLTKETFGTVGFVAAILTFPILMRWHYELLLFSWFANITIFSCPADPICGW